MRPTRSPFLSTTRVPRSSSSFTSFFFDVLMSERQPPDEMVVEPVLPRERVGFDAVDVDVNIDSGLRHLRPRHAKDRISADAEVSRHECNEAFPARTETSSQDQRARFEVRHARLLAVRHVDGDPVDLAEVAFVGVDELVVEQLADEEIVRSHQPPPMISSGMVTIATIDARTIVTMTTVFPIGPFVCSRMYVLSLSRNTNGNAISGRITAVSAIAYIVSFSGSMPVSSNDPPRSSMITYVIAKRASRSGFLFSPQFHPSVCASM